MIINYGYFITEYPEALEQALSFGMIIGAIVSLSGFGIYIVIKFFTRIAE